MELVEIASLLKRFDGFGISRSGSWSRRCHHLMMPTKATFIIPTFCGCDRSARVPNVGQLRLQFEGKSGSIFSATQHI